MKGIRKGSKHSYNDFGLTIKSKSIGVPSKNKIKETIPFMNGSYDFSTLYGSQTYSERTLKYVFNVVGKNKIKMNTLRTQVLDWLHEGSKQPIYDDDFPGYYFLAECEDADFDEDGRFGSLTVEFSAYPFLIRTEHEGSIYWDNFNFDLDILQETKFNIEGNKDIKIYNNGAINIVPTIMCSEDMQIIKDNITYNIKAGLNKSYVFELEKGENAMKIIGNGTIEFEFRKEVL